MAKEACHLLQVMLKRAQVWDQPSMGRDEPCHRPKPLSPNCCPCFEVTYTDLGKSGKLKKNKKQTKIALFYCSTWHQNRKYAFIGVCVSSVSVFAWMHVVRTAGIEECVCVCISACVCFCMSEWCMLACTVNTFKQFITQAVGKPFAKQHKGLLIRLKSLSNPPWRQNPSVTHNDTQGANASFCSFKMVRVNETCVFLFTKPERELFWSLP